MIGMSYINAVVLFICLTLLATTAGYPEKFDPAEDMRKNPARYIEIHDWGFYVAARVAVLHHITIENKSSVEYEDIKVRVNYYSASPGAHGYKVGFQDKVLKIKLPPHSKATYLPEGIPIGAGSAMLKADNIEVRSARAVH